MDDIYVRIIDMPENVNEFIAPGIDGYNIYLNNKLCHEKMLQCYNHALDHIRRRDFDGGDVQKIEGETHLRVYNSKFDK